MERIKFFNLKFPTYLPYDLDFFAPEEEGMLKISFEELEEVVRNNKDMSEENKELFLSFLKRKLLSACEKMDRFFYVPLRNSIFHVDMRRPTIVIVDNPYTVYFPEGSSVVATAVYAGGGMAEIPEKVAEWLRKCYSHVNPLSTAFAKEFVRSIEENRIHPRTTVLVNLSVMFGNDNEDYDEDYEEGYDDDYDEDEYSEGY